MSPGQRTLFFVTGWLIVLMPFLFWWNTWFGRQLSDQQMSEYLHDDKKPRHIQHALVQIGERMEKQDRTIAQWYPDLTRLASYPVEEVRNTDAWLMGQDTSGPDFHNTLLKMLDDSSVMVRGNAALSLVRYGDATGRPQIIALLQPAIVSAPQAGKIADATTVGTSVHQGGLVAKLDSNGQTIEIRSPIAGRLQTLSATTGQQVASGTTVATITPSEEQAWEALRALFLVGKPEDLPVVQSYERELPEISDRVRQQAVETDKAIRGRN